MNPTIDWEILTDYFLPSHTPEHQEEWVDIEYELYGRQNYRRDARTTTHEEVRTDASLREALRLLDGLSSLSEDTGPRGVETAISTSPNNTNKNNTKEQTLTKPKVPYPLRCLSPVQVGDGDRGCTERPNSVCAVWPDPVTGCVYGGSCALLVGSDLEQYPCQHPPLQQSRVYVDRTPLASRRKFSLHHRRYVVPFASRSRWSKNSRPGKKRIKKSRPRKKVYKA